MSSHEKSINGKQRNVRSSLPLSNNHSKRTNIREGNGKMFSILPAEIIDQIVNYLERKDLFECMCTNSAFNMVFRPFLYHSPILNSRRQFALFFKSLEMPATTATNTMNNNTTFTRATAVAATTTPRTSTVKRRKIGNIPYITNLGEHVRSLEFEDGFILVDNIEALARTCPNVASLRFKWQNFPDNKMISIPKTRALRTPLPLLKRFHPFTLKSLTLKGSNRIYKNGVPRRLDVMILPALSYVPQLESLALDIDSLLITIYDLEELHELCPKLQQFECSPQIQLQETESDLSPGTIHQTIEPSKTMKKLSIANNFWSDTNACTTSWWAYITTKYPFIKTLILHSHDSQRRGINIKTTLLSQQQALTSSMVLKEYFPRLDEIHLGPFAQRQASRYPLLVKDIRKVSLYGDPTQRFSDWSNNARTSSIQHLALSVVPKALDHLDKLKRLTHLKFGSDIFMDMFYQELPLDIIFLACPLLHTLIATKCIIRYNDDNNGSSDPNNENGTQETLRDNHGTIPMTTTTSSSSSSSSASLSPMLPAVPLKKLILQNTVIKNSNALTRIAERCPRLSHVDLSSCLWLYDLSDISTIRVDMSSHYFSYFRISQPGVCFNILSDADSFFIQFGLVESSHEDQQPRHYLERANGSDVYFMMKLKETEKKGGGKLDETASAALFEVRRARYKPQFMNIKRCHNKSVMAELNKVENDGSGEVEQQVIKKALSDRHRGLENHPCWSTVFSCRRVDQFYFDNIRLSYEELCQQTKG